MEPAESQTQEERRRRRHEARTSSSYATFLKLLSAVSGKEREDAEKAAQAVLCALEHRLFGPEIRKFEAELPVKLREVIHSCELHEHLGARKLHKDEFLQMIAEHLNLSVFDAESLAREVFASVRLYVSEGEVRKLLAQLPKDIAALWSRAD